MSDHTEAVLSYLGRRRTIPAAYLAEPGPSEHELATILELGVRVPDHGKLGPWRLIHYTKAARQMAASHLDSLVTGDGDETAVRKRRDAAARFGFAAATVGVVSSPKAGKVPEWEQVLSAGAVCLNLMHAANAHGFAAQWLTEWYAYDEAASRYLGLREGERFAGFIHIGTPSAPPTERDRPKAADVTSVWTPPPEGR